MDICRKIYLQMLCVESDLAPIIYFQRSPFQEVTKITLPADLNHLI